MSPCLDFGEIGTFSFEISFQSKDICILLERNYILGNVVQKSTNILLFREICSD